MKNITIIECALVEYIEHIKSDLEMFKEMKTIGLETDKLIESKQKELKQARDVFNTLDKKYKEE